MDIELEQVIDDWKYLRSNSKAFIEELTEEELHRKMPRPGIDTFMKHFEEMCDVEQAYLDACISGSMEFDCVKENDEYDGASTKADILSMMQIQDERLEAIANEYADNNVVWDEDDVKTICSQLRNLCIHETLHLGQLIAFSYAMGISIPEFIIESWALS